MGKHRSESRHLSLGVAGLAVVLALWCSGDTAGTPAAPTAGATTHVSDAPGLEARIPDAQGSESRAPDDAAAPTARAAAPDHAASPASGAREPSASPIPTHSPRSSGPATSPPAGAPVSPPSRLVVERIGLDQDLMQLGLRPDHTLEVPPEGPGSPAGWYRGSPAPGQSGPAVVLGHVNASGGGPGVFADLHVLTPGDEIGVQRADGTQAQFRVTHAERYAKNAFPTMRVYGNTTDPQLRLITCDGYDPATGTFDENLVVYATLVDT